MQKGYEFSYISGVGASHQVYTGQCKLHYVVVNTTAAGAIEIIDGTAGSTPNVGELKSNVVEGTYRYDAQMRYGIRIVCAAASNITVCYSV